MMIHIKDMVMMAVADDGAIIARADRWSAESGVWTVPTNGPLWAAPLGWSSLHLDHSTAITAMALAGRLAGGASQNDPHVVSWWAEIVACHKRMTTPTTSEGKLY